MFGIYYNSSVTAIISMYHEHPCYSSGLIFKALVQISFFLFSSKMEDVFCFCFSSYYSPWFHLFHHINYGNIYKLIYCISYLKYKMSSYQQFQNDHSHSHVHANYMYDCNSTELKELVTFCRLEELES